MPVPTTPHTAALAATVRNARRTVIEFPGRGDRDPDVHHPNPMGRTQAAGRPPNKSGPPAYPPDGPGTLLGCCTGMNPTDPTLSESGDFRLIPGVFPLDHPADQVGQEAGGGFEPPLPG